LACNKAPRAEIWRIDGIFLKWVTLRIKATCEVIRGLTDSTQAENDLPLSEPELLQKVRKFTRSKEIKASGVPPKKSLIRIGLLATHSRRQIEYALEKL
jgi:hypothetical protein